ETRADANYRANERADGTGAVSIETASNLKHTDAWTPEQMEQLIRLGVWLHQRHGIPLRICRTHDDPGYGYHALHSQWAVSGTACPGDARIHQFKEVVFPGIVARATGQTTPEEDMPLTADDIAKVAAAVWAHKETGPAGGTPVRTGAVQGWMDHVHSNQNAKLDSLAAKLAGLEQVSLTPEQTAAIAAQVAASPVLHESVAELVADKLATRLAN
ncbi:N-acetylmuramoyl-L-alanine amidase, partial [Streptomyces chartreusis]|uniref:peptidoglycan recognition protein family protein n=1 Tax=Streptomyces chartreusis TaxID=1969 RepID=UPI0037186FA9